MTYPITTASTAETTPLSSNRFIWLLFTLLLIYWVYGWFNCLLIGDWIMENILVVICLTLLVASHRWHRLSELSYLCIFMFVMLHLYGAFYAYTKNNFGQWLKDSFHLWRNPYDRIVHFSFGLLLAYPFREILINKYKLKGRATWLYPIEIAFSAGTVFEMIEWGVAAWTDTETGNTYVATQGDVWDPHKDIMMAAIGATISMGVLFLIKKRSAKREPGRGRVLIAPDSEM